MDFDLDKGDVFDFDKGVTSVRVGVGWKTADEKSKYPFDLDVHAFGCVATASGSKLFNNGSHALTFAAKALRKPDGTFATPDGSLIHSGDNLDGAGDGDDEVVSIDFTKLPSEINEVSVFITLHDAAKRGQSFAHVYDSRVIISDISNGKELCRYNLQNEFGGMIAVHIGSFSKTGNDWAFTVIGGGNESSTLGDIIKTLKEG